MVAISTSEYELVYAGQRQPLMTLAGTAITITETDVAEFMRDEDRLRRAQIDHARLLEIGSRNRPPQAWYDDDEEELF